MAPGNRHHALCFSAMAGLLLLQILAYLKFHDCKTKFSPSSIDTTPRCLTVHVPKLKNTNLSELSERFARRRAVVTSMCQLSKPRPLPPCETQSVRNNLKWVKSDNIIYCNVQKVSSTFWLRILKVLSESHKSKHPLSINPRKAYWGNFTELDQVANGTNVSEIIERARKVMVVRHPYVRLFSAWLDKMYLTNTYYWKGIGASISKLRTKTKTAGGTQNNPKCGHDVRFSEFVDDIVNQVRTQACIDGHFSPIVSHCQPCQIDFQYISKLETLQEDTLFILKDLGLDHRVSLANLTEISDVDFISDVSNFVFENRKGLEDCNMTLKEGLHRAWRTLQARGLLSKRAEFLYTNMNATQIHSLNGSGFKAAILSAYRAYSADERGGNREEVLREAYSSLNRGQIDAIYTAFQRDFEYYDYERYPEFLNPPDNHGFRYLEFSTPTHMAR